VIDLNIKYRCLVLDHDDTAVKSTPDIHYPSFVEVLKVIRPDSTPLSLEEYIQYNFKPGFVELCRDILKMTDDEQEFQYRHWREYVKGRIPEFYSGVVELIRDFKTVGESLQLFPIPNVIKFRSIIE
jgi:phosphoglycolate phosphatase/pyrophosphatase PpaX